MRVLTAAALDVRMRMRRRGFLMLCLILLVSAFGFVPRESGVSVLVIEGFRPLSDPSWIPTACAQAAAVFLPIAGFVYVRTSLDTDRRTGVAAAVRASGAGRAAYFLGKYAANLVLLLALLAVMLLGALIMMLLRFPGQGCSVWAFVSPFFAAAPGLCLVAGLALLLEIPGRTPAGRALGNAMFAALWLTLFSLGVILPAESASPAVRTLGCFLEFTGYGWQSASLEMQTGAHANYFLSWVPEGSEALPPLAFSGLAWDPRQFAAKLLLLFIGPALALFAAALYPRQEKARAVRRDGKARTDAPRPKRQGGRLPAYQPLPPGRACLGWPRLLAAECRLFFTGLPLVWGLVLAGVWIACLFAPRELAQSVLFPLVMGGAFLLFGRMGCRLQRHGPLELVRTAEGGPLRQLTAEWGAGTLASILAALPVAARGGLAGEWNAAAACLALAAAVPAVAQMCGLFTRSERLFEIGLLLFVFIELNTGEVYGLAAGSAEGGKAVFLLLLAAISLALSVLKRNAEGRQR